MDACHKKDEFRKQAGVDVFILHQLKNKYEGINFVDEDQTEDGSGIYIIDGTNLEWLKRSKGVAAGWRVLAMPEDSTGDEEALVAYAIDDTLHEMIEAAKTKGRMQHVTLIQAPATDAMEEDEGTNAA